MTHSSKPEYSLPARIYGAILGAVLLALLGSSLASQRLAQASTGAGLHVTPFSESDVKLTMSNTVFLPLVSQPWNARGKIAFERRVEGVEQNHDIYVMDDDGSGLENLTNNPDADDGAPTWSPDGNFLAFASTRVGNGNHAIYKMDLRTRQVIQLTSGEYDDRWPAWSPKGDQVAFMRKMDGPNEIFVMSADGTNEQRLTNWDGRDEFPAWSPDAEWIVFSSDRYWVGRDLWLIRPDGTGLQIVLRTDGDHELYPSWAADGRIYYTFHTVNDGTKYLYRIWPDSSGREKIFDDSFNRYMASWSPDSQCFVFYSYMGGPDKEVWKWCEGLSQPINLTDNEGISDEFCAWSPVP